MNNALLTLPLPTHFSFKECLWFLDRNFDECLYRVKEGGVERIIDVDGHPLLVRITGDEQQLSIHSLDGAFTARSRKVVSDYVTHWFDLKRDLAPFYQLLQQDKRLAYMVQDFEGLRLMGIPDVYEALCWCIIGQQINLPFAYKLKRRLVEGYGISMQHNGTTYHQLPAYETLAQISTADFKAMQFSTSKGQYLVNVARAFADGQLSLAQLEALPDMTARQQLLTSIKGIGTWSANYVLMKCLRDGAAIPFGDSGLNAALLSHGIISDKKDTQGILRFFKPFAGWESYLVFYLWRSLSKVTVPGK
jgi:DNA-3-methyladenine glycosylase II